MKRYTTEKVGSTIVFRFYEKPRTLHKTPIDFERMTTPSDKINYEEFKVLMIREKEFESTIEI